MALEIPSRYIPAMNKIRNLSDAAVDELVVALESSNIAEDPEELAAAIAESVPSIPKEDLSSIVDAAYSLYHVREFSELKRSSFFDELFAGIRTVARPEISNQEIPHLSERFQRLLSINTLETIAKAIGMQRQGEHLYCESKIISDIRPVFGENVKSRPVAAVLTHTLKIGYHQKGSHEEFFVVLDEVDLDDLHKVIKRAKTKAETLTKVLGDFKLPRLGI